MPDESWEISRWDPNELGNLDQLRNLDQLLDEMSRTTNHNAWHAVSLEALFWPNSMATSSAQS